MGRKPKQKTHYAPKLANKEWADETNHLRCYKRRYDLGKIIQKPEGRKNWGWKLNLWSEETETALDRELETPVMPIYTKLLNLQELSTYERTKWAQFLRSQIVRSPNFMRYESWAREHFGIEKLPGHHRIGCECCVDLTEITGRRWLILEVEDDSYFIRSDCPVFHTSFLWDPGAVVFYPLSPRKCFVATAMPDGWSPVKEAKSPHITMHQPISKIVVYMLNFYMSKSADESIVMHSHDAGIIDETMFTQTLGVYPQPPFDLHGPDDGSLEEARESIRMIMSAADGHEYPLFNPKDLPDWMP